MQEVLRHFQCLAMHVLIAFLYTFAGRIHIIYHGPPLLQHIPL